MIETDDQSVKAPELHRDQQKVADRRSFGIVPILLAGTLLLLFVILVVFMPRS